jgi:hypothetical protein
LKKILFASCEGCPPKFAKSEDVDKRRLDW